MSSGRKCKNCGSSDIEVDPGRGDAVCTNCGSVLEDSIIVSEVQFEEGAHGSSSAIGQFVSAESKGGATKFGASFHLGIGVESREITLKKARNGIQQLCNQLQLNQHCIDTACSFFRMALSRNLTRGRKNTHVHAACVYLTCRTEGTAHLLIDISDVLQICCYELGRTYLKLSQALCINIPAVDPCLYIMRFAAKLEFGSRTQHVVNTALRLVQRMKRDSIHSGRRPSGLCGAALLIAARLHEFSRTSSDIVKIVKVHESTLRKRLIEFGDTPSSALTLEEFLTVDLEEEQDPPSFKAARKKDKERLQKVFETEADKISQFQKEIEIQLERDGKNRRNTKHKKTEFQEQQDTVRFIQESTMGAIKEIIENDDPVEVLEKEPVKGLGPDIASMGLANSLDDTSNNNVNNSSADLDLTFDDIDDKELDMYIMSESESLTKNGLWHKRNADYLQIQKDKEEKLRKEREEGKPEKKRKRVQRKKNIGPTNSAGEAIEKILQEKKISTKINYDVLKSLNAPPLVQSNTVIEDDVAPTTSESIRRRRLSSLSNFLEQSPAKVKKTSANLTSSRKGKEKVGFGLPYVEAEVSSPIKKEKKEELPTMSEEELDEDYEEDVPDNSTSEIGVLQMLREHNQDGNEEGEEYFGYDGEDY